MLKITDMHAVIKNVIKHVIKKNPRSFGIMMVIVNKMT